MIVSFLAVSLAFLIESSVALPLSEPAQLPDSGILTAGERWPPTTEQIWLSYHIDMPEGVSFREQHLNQDALAVLLANNASQLSGIKPCDLTVRYRDLFGDFAIGARHPNPTRRIECLRGAVGYLLRQPIGETDFRAIDRKQAYRSRMGFPLLVYAQQLALLAIYQKYSPLFQIHSVGEKDLSELSFEDFGPWLRRIRAQNLITFAAKTALLDSLDLPVPDPMILRPAPSLKSPRVSAGVLFFEGDLIGVPALVMVDLGNGDPNSYDLQAAERLGCIRDKPSLASAGSAISRVSCGIYTWYGEYWLGLAILKSDAASDQDFCRQAPELIRDPIVAALARSTPEGMKGLYLLLPRQCEAQP
jgi:hypothetical protein